MECGEIIKYLRIKNGLTQDELGVILGVKKSAIQKYESGAIQNLKMETLKQLCDYFDVAPFAFTHPERVKDIEHVIEFYRRAAVLTDSIIANLNNEGMDRLEAYIYDLLKIEDYKKTV